MSIIRSRTNAGLTRTFMVLVLLLFAAQLLASQPMVMGGEERSGDSACAFIHAPLADDARADGKIAPSDGYEKAQGTHQCETSIDGGLCSINCSLPYAGKSADVDFRPMAAMYNFSSFAHIGRLISGPEPFPPKPALIS